VVAAGALLAAVNVTGVPTREQRVAVLGAGGAGSGISALLLRAMIEDGLPEAEARARFYLVDRDGLLVEGMRGLMPFQEPFLQPRSAVAGWTLEREGVIGLGDVVRNARPSVLIGVSGQPGAFPEQVIRDMAASAERPVIFPLSNPTSRAEATPADLMAWPKGRAVVGAGSPFQPLLKNGAYVRVDQTNNSYVFPGIGLAAIAVRAGRVSHHAAFSVRLGGCPNFVCFARSATEHQLDRQSQSPAYPTACRMAVRNERRTWRSSRFFRNAATMHPRPRQEDAS
jgi:malate dehydrogenase (oxaloacetate-decarboxylating)